MESAEFLFDDRAPSFRLLAGATTALARAHGVQVDDTTVARWSDMGGLIRELDTLRDDYGTATNEILSRLSTYTEFADHYPHLSPESLSHEEFSRILRYGRIIFALGERIGHTSDPEQFAHLRRREAILSARLITHTATEHTMDSIYRHPAFIHDFTQFTMGLTFIDSFLDARTDYLDHKTVSPPSLAHYRALRRTGGHAIRRALSLMLTPTLTRQAARMTYQRVTNRLEHGMTPYTTLRNISPRRQ